eukprot:COSAG03_NODE_213_length_10549_cov_7.843349_2_plen_1370_part_00
MGIKRLTAFLTANYDPVAHPPTVLPPGSRLLIDASGWSFLLQAACVAAGVRQDHLGDYGALDRAVEEMVQKIRSAGVVPILYCDGEVRQMKAAATKRRRKQRDGKWELLQGTCLDGQRVQQKDLPEPPLMMRQVLATAAALCVQVVRCRGEADQDMAIACAEQRHGDWPHYVLGQDSDFYMFRGCNYVCFGDLTFSASDGSAGPQCSPHPRTARAVVWTRAILSEMTGLNERQLIEFAILLGNDYTAPFSKDLYGDEVAALGNDEFDPDVILEFVAEAAPELRLSSNFANVQRAIDFSRALYECEDLSAFPADAEESSEEEDEDYEIILQGTDGTVGQVALQELVTSRRLQPYQLEALSAVVRGHREEKAPERLRWDDVCAARRFQRLCAEMDGTGLLKPGAPADWYHGPTFHSLAQKCDTREQASRQAPGVQRICEPEPEPEPELDASGMCALPIDAHREDILRHIKHHRVTIIQGETGCGKSSRLPHMLMQSGGPRVKMMVAQPRRIAAHSLMQRAKQDGLADVVGMRMGHGVREESNKTRLWYVTTGYLVRLASHRPESFKDHDYLIIDEVHERSVDSDILCMLSRRLLQRWKNLRLILMSATVHTKMYQEYYKEFKIADPVFVGARRFPVKIFHAEDLKELGMPKRMSRVIDDVCASARPGQTDVNSRVGQLQHQLCFWLTRTVATEGSAVLIFVSGIADIEALMDQFEAIPRYTCCPIHSDIPFEDQLSAFQPVKDAVKVIIATNAAESSITLPDVDHVICLGTHKQVRYNEHHHQTQLINTWISKASATQRAGRTGRVRPGTAYRLYPQSLFDALPEHECSEIHRQPLDSTILQLRAMLDQQVVPVLQETLEPPDLSHVDRSFKSLFEMGMISEASDDGHLTDTGHLAASLPVDLKLSRMIALSVTIGVVKEAIVMAAAMTLARLPFRIASPLVHKDPDEYNDIVRVSMAGKYHFDAGCYSEPIMMMNVYVWFKNYAGGAQRKKCTEYGLAYAQVQRLLSTVDSLRRSVADLLGCDASKLELRTSPKADPQSLMKVRLLLLWAFSDNLLDSQPTKAMKKSDLPSNAVGLSGSVVTREQLDPLFPAGVSYTLESTATHTIHANMTIDRSYNDSIAEMQVIVDALSPEMAVLIWRKEKICISVLARSLEAVLNQLSQVVSDGSKRETRVGNRVQISVDASKAKIKALSWIKSRRGMGVHLTTLTLSVGCGTSALVCTGKEPSEDEARRWFGPQAKWSTQTGSTTQTVIFEESAASEDGLIRDRALGLRLLLGMAHGYKDCKLRLRDPKGVQDEDKIELGLSLLPKHSSPGLIWEHDLGQALTGRHGVLTVAVDLQKRPLYAVAASTMMVGNDRVSAPDNVYATCT